MKIKFKFTGAETVLSAFRENDYSLGAPPIVQPNKSILSFQSIDGSVNVSITLDERHRLAQQLVIGMQNEVFEFDFSQPLPVNRLNP